MSGLDIIGDIHGHASKLEDRLLDLGYTVDPDTGAYRHADRRAVFVGDLIDRGPDQLRVLDIVKAMVDGGSAHIVMGNHEFNAIAYATEDPHRPGEHRRPHDQKNTAQHRAFLEQLTQQQRTYYTDWFMTLPLWLELDGVRVVHACWHEPSRAVVRAELGGAQFTTVEQIVSATDGNSPLYEAVEVLLKGPEVSLVDYGLPAYRDKDGHRREKARARWWHRGATTLAELAEVRSFQTEDGKPYPPLPDVDVDPEDRSYVYNDRVPVFYGHYWRTNTPVHLDDWTEYTACVDFSAGKGGTLVAYRWSGEATISLDRYVPHGADVVAQTPEC